MTQAEKEAVLSLRQQHYSFSTIAEKTELPLGTIKSFLSRVGEKKVAPSPTTAPRVTLNHQLFFYASISTPSYVRGFFLFRPLKTSTHLQWKAYANAYLPMPAPRRVSWT